MTYPDRVPAGDVTRLIASLERCAFLLSTATFHAPPGTALLYIDATREALDLIEVVTGRRPAMHGVPNG